MPVIDAQTHLWGRNLAERPWNGKGQGGPEEVSPEMVIDMMDAEGIDGSIIVSPYSVYGMDPAYALEAADKYPERFAVISPVDPARPDIEDFVERWAARPHAVGLRLVLLSEASAARVLEGEADMMLARASRHGVPVCFGGRDLFPQMRYAAKKYPDLQVVIDHLGLYPLVDHFGFFTPSGTRSVRKTPFDDLPDLIETSRYPNIAIKATAVPLLSNGPYPYEDIWAPLYQVLDAFGSSRTMWGTDWTRTLSCATHSQGIRCYLGNNDLKRRLSADEFADLMGGSAERIFKWTPMRRDPQPAQSAQARRNTGKAESVHHS